MIQRALKPLAAALALALLVWLYVRSNQIDVNLHVRVVAGFEQLQQQDARLTQFILQSRYGLLQNYDPLVRTSAEIRRLLDALRDAKPELFGSGSNLSQEEFQRIRELFAAKFDLVEQFKSHNSVLRNSLAYFPTAAQQEIAEARNAGTVARLRDLLEHVLIYGQDASADNRMQVETASAALLRERAQAQSLVGHARIILDHKPEVDSLVQEIAQVQTEPLARKLFTYYNLDFAERDRSAANYKLALVLLAGLMLGYVIWALNNLQRARATLSQSLRELEFQKFALDQHSIVSVTDRTGKILYTNGKFTEISQYQRDELLGQDHRLLNSGYHPSSFFKEMWATIGRGQVWHGEVRNRRKDGTPYWVNSTIVPFMDEQGRPLRYVSIRTDITARKAMDAQLEEQRTFYERVTETLGEGLYVQDALGRCVYMNSEAERLLGWTRTEFLGRPVHDTIHVVDANGQTIAPADCAILCAVMRHGQARMEDQIFQHKDGSRFPVALASTAVRDEHGAMVAMVVAFEDISSRKQAELALLQAKEAAEQANRVKGDFLANMSHEIRTPMNGIIGMTALALDTSLTREQRDYLLMVKSSADALLNIINDILDLSKIEAGKMAIEAVECSLEHMLRDTLRTLAVRAHQKNLELMLHVAPDVPDKVFADSGRLRQVLVNLIGNAIKFTAHGEIEVSIQRRTPAPAQHARLCFGVRDTGIGIPADKFRAIFESFSQADTSTTRKFGGTGLGLTISAQLIELMGGHIEVQSQVGLGSTFTFTLDLPVTEDQPLATSQHTRALQGMPVLAVDDNASSRALLQDMLLSWHMQPLLFESANEALAAVQDAAARGQPYPLLISDAEMPEMDGLTLIEKARAVSPLTVAVLLLASQAQRSQAVGGLQEVDCVVVKPVTQSDLLDAIMTALGLQAELADTLIPHDALRTTQRPLSLLLAEDNEVNQALAMRLLEKLGHTITLARNGAEAVQWWRDGRFDAILMDVDMPVMNGYQATQEIRALEAAMGAQRTPIVAMTAHAMQGVREECLRHGMDGYVSKPIDTQALLQVLGDLERAADSAARSDRANPAPVRSNLSLEGRIANLAQTRIALDDDRDLYDEILGLYRQDAPRQLLRIMDAAAHDDVEGVRRGAHAIKGMVGVFGAERAMHAAEALERCADPARLDVLTTQLRAALDELDAAMTAYHWD